MTLSHTQQRDLVQLIAQSFNMAEMANLAFEYGVDLANFGVAGPNANAREMVLYAVRHVGVPKLLQAINNLRPDLDLRPFGGSPPRVDGGATDTLSVGTSETSSEKSTSESGYVNFDIRIGEKRADGRYPITARSDQGYGETDSTTWQALPDDYDFEDTLSYLRELVGRPKDAEDLGSRLRQFLFPTKVLDLYNLSLAKVQAENRKGLRIRIRIDRNAPELSKIPWEYCFDDKSFLALNEETPFVRYIETTERPEPITTPEKVRVLVVMAGPTDWPELNSEAEEAWINESLSKFVQAGRVEVKVLPHATRGELRRQFRRYNPHIFHFIGHGKLLDNSEGALVLEDDNGAASAVSAKDMHLLLQSSEVKLVILSACQTADHGTGEAIMGVAPRLIWAGVPAAIAMQFRIPDKTAIGFTRDLYEFLADGDPLDTAVTEARLGAYFDNEDKVFWAIPVLFMRAPDGVIWQ